MINLIWDLDGTLIDSEQEVLVCLNKAIEAAGLNSKNMKSAFRVGPTVDNILRNSFSEEFLCDGKLEKAMRAFRNCYDNSDFSKTHPFEGIDFVIKNVKEYRHYIITNKPDAPSNKIIQKLGWSSYITKLVTPYTFGTDKKNKLMLFNLLVNLEKLDKNKTYGIGDMDTDMRAAKSAGINTIGVLWGTGTEKELVACNYLCNSVISLSKLLEALCER